MAVSLILQHRYNTCMTPIHDHSTDRDDSHTRPPLRQITKPAIMDATTLPHRQAAAAPPATAAPFQEHGLTPPRQPLCAHAPEAGSTRHQGLQAAV